MIATIFDTNAYLNLVSQKDFDEVRSFVQNIKDAEAQKGYIAYIYPTVAEELLSHLLDKQSICKPTYTYTKACVAIYAHCSDKTSNSYRMSPLQELQIAHAYWGINNQIAVGTQTTICNLLYEIERNPNCRTINKYKLTLQQIKDFILEAEQSFVDGIEEVKQNILSQNSQYATWQDYLSDKKNRNAVTGYVNSPQLKKLLATSMIYAIAIDLQNKGIPSPNQQQIVKAIKIYMKDCAASLELQQILFSHWDDPNFQFGRPDRVNTIWDAKVLSCAGHKLQTGNGQGDEILLVTTDGNMITAAKRAIPNCKICTYNEYLNLLGL